MVGRTIHIQRIKFKDNAERKYPLADGPISDCLCDEDKILVTTNEPNNVVSKNNNIILHVKGPYGQLQFSDFDVKVDKSKKVSDIREEIIWQLTGHHDIEATDQIRLRPLSSSEEQAPPLIDDLPISCSSLVTGDTLILEVGRPISNKEILVKYSGDFVSGTRCVVIQKTASIADCIQKMVCGASLDASDLYFLQTTNWCGEPAEVLYDIKQPIYRTSGPIQHGSLLRLSRGLPPPKDQLTLTVKHKVLDTSAEPQTYLQWVVGSQPDTSSIWVETVHVSLDASIDELKVQLLSLSPERIPSVGYIRLRAEQGGLPASIYKTGSKTLRSLKIRDHSTILAQILPQAEHLR